jgi:tetratricopeptide (TPR) repeat protein
MEQMTQQFQTGFMGMLLLIGFAGLQPTAVRAQEAADVDAQARDAYEQAQQQFDDGDYAGAAEGFRSALALKPSWKILFNLGQAEAAAKNYGAALTAFEEYLARGGDEVAADRKDEVLEEIRRLRDMVGALDIEGPAGAVVYLDGKEQGPLPLPGVLKVSAGIEYDLRIVRDGAEILSRRMRVSSGDTLFVNARTGEESLLSADAAKEADDAGPEAERNRKRALRIAGWVSLGTGVASLGAGAITGGMALSLNNDLVDRCDGGDCLPAQHGDLDRRDGLATASTITVVVGATAAAAGVLLLLLGRKTERTTTTAVFPFYAGGGVALALTGRF